MASYALYPVPAFLSPAITESPSLSPLTLLFLTTGTALCSASANSLNMLYEPSTDAKMTRTRNRPLVRGLLSTRAAVMFAVATALTGVGALYFGVNPTVACLGGANIFIYAGMYTPMKAMSAANTWLGATASGDGSWRELLLASDGSSIGGWLMAGLLFAWQFPHFMALSWPIREEYKAAGLRMLAWTNPARNARVALRYSIAFIPLCVALCAAGVTEWSFAVTSLPVNGWLSGLFWASVWHLPVVMVLALLQKKGMWSRVWNSVMGSDEDEWEDDELDEMPVTPPAPRR
uniref:Protoheme IX farnesyltransferase, mitochondrial n=1 Tax=Colletotrichum fructicola (strain Nara gc5) TaxID=1213859 RepID=L2FL49_COLFN